MSSATPTKAEICYLGLGSNIGDKILNVKRATEALDSLTGTKVVKRSSYYRSEPWGYKEQEWFVNAVAAAETVLPPSQLLTEIKALENRLGRTPPTRQWGPRVVDIDILLYGRLILKSPELSIPHSLLTKRLFVLIPLLEIAPTLTLPGTDEPLQNYANSLEGKQRVEVMEE